MLWIIILRSSAYKESSLCLLVKNYLGDSDSRNWTSASQFYEIHVFFIRFGRVLNCVIMYRPSHLLNNCGGYGLDPVDVASMCFIFLKSLAGKIKTILFLSMHSINDYVEMDVFEVLYLKVTMFCRRLVTGNVSAFETHYSKWRRSKAITPRQGSTSFWKPEYSISALNQKSDKTFLVRSSYGHVLQITDFFCLCPSFYDSELMTMLKLKWYPMR